MIDFLAEAQKRREQIIDDIIALCKIPSVHDDTTVGIGQPFGKECRNALDAMLSIGKRDGFEVEDVDGYAGHIDIGNQEDTFGILGHLDVVPCNSEGWLTDPYNPVIDNGILYGRGVSDDKGPLIAGYYAAKIIHELNIPTKMKTRIIFGCNEEKGSGCVKYYFTKKPYPKMGFTPDASFPVVHGEKAMASFKIHGHVEKDNIIGLYGGTVSNIVPELCEAYVSGPVKVYKDSFMRYLKEHDLQGSLEEEGNHTKLTLKGKSAHASMPELGKNGVTYMCHYLATVSQNKLVHFIDQCFHKAYFGEKLDIHYEGKMGPLTLNLGILNYKDENVMMTLDLRLPHEVSEDFLVTNIEKHLKEYGLVQNHHYSKGLYLDPECELVQKLHQAYVDITGDQDSKPETMGGGTYAKSMPNCVAFGAEFKGRDNKIHGNNEEIYVEDIIKATAIYAKALYELTKE